MPMYTSARSPPHHGVASLAPFLPQVRVTRYLFSKRSNLNDIPTYHEQRNAYRPDPHTTLPPRTRLPSPLASTLPTLYGGREQVLLKRQWKGQRQGKRQRQGKSQRQGKRKRQEKKQWQRTRQSIHSLLKTFHNFSWLSPTLFRRKQQERATVLCRRGPFALRAGGERERGRGTGQVERCYFSPITSSPIPSPIHIPLSSLYHLSFFIPRFSTHKYVVTIHSLQYAGLFYRSMVTEIILLQKATVVRARTEVTRQLAVWAAQWERREGTAFRTCRAGRSLTRSTTVSIQLFIGSQKVSKSAKKNL